MVSKWNASLLRAVKNFGIPGKKDWLIFLEKNSPLSFTYRQNSLIQFCTYYIESNNLCQY